MNTPQKEEKKCLCKSIKRILSGTPPPINTPDNESILQEYKQKIKNKRNVVDTHIIIMAILFLADIVVYIVYNSTIPTNGKIMLWLFLLILSIALYYMVRKSHRYQNALYRLDILLLRIKLDKSNDLVKPYCMDREIEMIYRILEA